MKKLIETKSFEDFIKEKGPVYIKIKIKQVSEWKVSFYEENELKYIYLENVLDIEDERLKEKITLNAKEIIDNYNKLMEYKIDLYSKTGAWFHHNNIFSLVDVIEKILEKQVHEILNDIDVKIDVIWDEEKLLSLDMLLSKCQHWFSCNN